MKATVGVYGVEVRVEQGVTMPIAVTLLATPFRSRDIQGNGLGKG